MAGSSQPTNPEPDQVIAPRLYLGRGDSGGVLRFRRGMSESTCAALRDLAAPDLTSNDCNREPVNRVAIVALLAAEQPIENIYFGPAFSFPDALNHESPWSPNSRPLRHSGGSRNPDPSPPEVVEISPSEHPSAQPRNRLAGRRAGRPRSGHGHGRGWRLGIRVLQRALKPRRRRGRRRDPPRAPRPPLRRSRHRGMGGSRCATRGASPSTARHGPTTPPDASQPAWASSSTPRTSTLRRRS